MFKKIATYICILLLSILWVVNINIGTSIVGWGVLTTYAADPCTWPSCPTAPKTDGKEVTEMMNKLITGWNIVLGLLTAIVSPAILFAGWLMSPDWTSGDLFGIRPLIHDLWIMVSNVTYFIYAILLIFIALATIFNSDKYGYKQLLPKLALGIIMVPLTWWFIQFIISLASIVTASVMNIPMEALGKYTTTNPSVFQTESIPKRIPIDISFDSDKKSPVIDCKVDKSQCTTPTAILNSAWGIYSPLLIYAYSIFKVDKVKQLNSWTDYVKAPIDVLHQVIFGSIMFFIFGLLVLALIFMLMVRAIKLWFYAIFSPLMTLKFVLWDSIFGKWGDNSFDLKEFIGLAFVPAIVGLCLSFGLMILSILHSPNLGASSLTPTATCTEPLVTTTGCELAGLMGNPANKIVRKAVPEWTSLRSVYEFHFWGIVFEFKGQVATATEVASAANGGVWVISSAWGLFGTLIVDIIAIIFIWVAFMAAKGVSKVAETAFAPFEDIGKKMSGLAMSLPKYTPIPGTGGMSVGSMAKVPGLVEEWFRVRNDKRFEESEMWGKLKAWAGATSAAEAARYREALSKTGKESAEMMRSAISDGIKNGTGENIGRETQAGKYIDAFAEKMKKGEITEENLRDAKINGQIARKMFERSKTIDKQPLTEDERTKFAAWLAGNTDEWLQATEAKIWLKDKKNASAGTAGWNNTSSGFVATPVWTDKVDIRFNSDLKVQVNNKTGDGITDEQANQLKKLAQTMTKAEFENKFSWVDTEVVKKLISKIGEGEFKKVEPKK
jgi:hypothetical protein